MSLNKSRFDTAEESKCMTQELIYGETLQRVMIKLLLKS